MLGGAVLIIPELRCGQMQVTESEPATAEYQVFKGSYAVNGTSLYISYDMYSNPDRLQVFDASGGQVYDSGYVGTDFACEGQHPALDSNGNGCRGLTGPSRSESWELESTCPIPNPIRLSVSPQVRRKCTLLCFQQGFFGCNECCFTSFCLRTEIKCYVWLVKCGKLNQISYGNPIMSVVMLLFVLLWITRSGKSEIIKTLGSS